MVDHTEHSQALLTDEDRVKLVSDDINGKKRLNKQTYKMLLQDIERRARENAPEVEEGIAWSLLELNQAGTIEQVEHVSKGTAAVLNQLGPIGLIIANGIGLLLIPWICYREKRWPTRDEWIKLGLSAAAIALLAVAIALPVVAIWLSLAAAAVITIKSVQSIRDNKKALHRLEQLAEFSRQEIERLHKEIDELEKVQHRSLEQEETLSKKREELTATTDQYVKEGHQISELKEKIEHPIRSLLAPVNVATSAVALIAIAVSIVSPLVGAGMLIGAGLISLGMLVVSTIAEKIANRKNSTNAPIHSTSTHAPVDKPEPEKENTDALEQKTHQLSSTAREMNELNEHPVPHSEPSLTDSMSPASQPIQEKAKVEPKNAASSTLSFDEEHRLKEELQSITHPTDKEKKGDESKSDDEGKEMKHG